MPRDRRPTLPVLLGVAAVVAIAFLHMDRIQARAESALGRGMPAREAELARGFVLGQDDGIDPRTVDDFRRSGLSHLLAVSGENVTLLALLAMPVLAALGIPLRERLLWVLGLIAVYVPLTGAGPSIQRAGVMGALGVLATLAGRRASRFYALAIAAIVTLAIDPRVGADVGWQLSFAAVVGILLLATPLREAIAARIGSRGWRRALAEGAAVTIAATLATAPLIAYRLRHGLDRDPRREPAGDARGGAGDVAGDGLGRRRPAARLPGRGLQRRQRGAARLHRPGRGLVRAAELGLRPRPAERRRPGRLLRRPRRRRWSSPSGSRARRRRRRGAERPRPTAPARGRSPRIGPRPGGSSAGSSGSSLLAAPRSRGAERRRRRPTSGLRVEVLDVGQGDAILLQPAGAPAVLVDGGPPGDDLAAKLRGAGVEGLGAAVVTHDQSDHAGGVEELLGRFPVDRLVYAVLGRQLLGEARAAGAAPYRVAEGSELRSGGLRLEVLWPPRELLSEPLAAADPNQRALVILARWHGFSMLLTADAEAEAVPIDPGPIDVLKVAHHGSDDAGLGALLDRTAPKLAVISVGEDNPYGHPTPATLATLAAHGIRTLRTDLDGTVVLEVHRGSVEVSTGD